MSDNRSNLSSIQAEFALDQEIYYLNHAAVSPWPKRTADTSRRFADENVRYGATYYANWVEAEHKLKTQFCSLLNIPATTDIALLKNTSEALSVVACGLPWRKGDNVVSTDQEFPSNRIVWEAQVARYDITLRQVDVARTDDPESALINACDEKTRVLAVSSVQYGTGLKLDLVKLGQFCRCNAIYFCVDAIQSICAHAIDIKEINADFVMADAHKWMCGPEGVALFYCRPEIREQLRLYQFGWHMVQHSTDYTRKDWSPAHSARRFECGSPNMLGIHALSASLSLFEEIGITTVSYNLSRNVDYLIDKITKFNDISLISPMLKERRSGIVTCRFNQVDSETLHARLTEQKVICAKRAGGIRFSPHFYTPREVIDKAIEVISLNI